MMKLELDALQVIIFNNSWPPSFISWRYISANSSTCPSTSSGSLRLTGGNTDADGVLEYCYSGKWSPFCNLDIEEAAVACKQLGYSKYVG